METNMTITGTGPRAAQERNQLAVRESLANDCARWAGDEALHEHDIALFVEDRSHTSLCCASIRESAEHDEYHGCMQMPLDALRSRHARARRDWLSMRCEQLLGECAASARLLGERAEIRAGAIPTDIRSAGWNAENYERYAHHYGQGADEAMLATLRRRRDHLQQEVASC